MHKAYKNDFPIDIEKKKIYYFIIIITIHS